MAPNLQKHGSSADGSKKHDDSADGFFGDWAKRGDVLAGYVSREALAQQFGISERTLSRWETISHRTAGNPRRPGRHVPRGKCPSLVSRAGTETAAQGRPWVTHGHNQNPRGKVRLSYSA